MQKAPDHQPATNSKVTHTIYSCPALVAVCLTQCLEIGTFTKIRKFVRKSLSPADKDAVASSAKSSSSNVAAMQAPAVGDISSSVAPTVVSPDHVHHPVPGKSVEGTVTNTTGTVTP